MRHTRVIVTHYGGPDALRSPEWCRCSKIKDEEDFVNIFSGFVSKWWRDLWADHHACMMIKRIWKVGGHSSEVMTLLRHLEINEPGTEVNIDL